MWKGQIKNILNESLFWNDFSENTETNYLFLKRSAPNETRLNSNAYGGRVVLWPLCHNFTDLKKHLQPTEIKVTSNSTMVVLKQK